MNLAHILRTDSDGVTTISHTEAVLEARELVAGLHIGPLPLDARDELVDLVTDLLHRFDGMVSEETHQAVVKEAENAANETEDLQREKNDEEARADEAEEKLEELADAATDTPEELLSKYTDLVLKVDALQAKADKADRMVRAITTAFAKAKRTAKSDAARKSLEACEKEINAGVAKTL